MQFSLHLSLFSMHFLLFFSQEIYRGPALVWPSFLFCSLTLFYGKLWGIPPKYFTLNCNFRRCARWSMSIKGKLLHFSVHNYDLWALHFFWKIATLNWHDYLLLLTFKSTARLDTLCKLHFISSCTNRKLKYNKSIVLLSWILVDRKNYIEHLM